MLTIALMGPVTSALLNYLFGRLIGNNIKNIVLLLYWISSITSIMLVYHTAVNSLNQSLLLSNWSLMLNTSISFTIDLINSSLLAVVLTIGTCVITYTYYYMADDPHLNRFINLLSCFVTFMAILAISSNLIVLFLGWELIGLYSYLLIGYWSDRTEAGTAALSAMLQNKFGDYLLSLGILLTYSQCNTLDCININTIYTYVQDNYLIVLIGISYIIASMAKSAQLGLHIWLIHAMQGPTPVSSLLHAATLVVAGPILLFKVNAIINTQVSLIVIIGIITALLGSILALIQADIKGTIAYSTMSQFGYIISIAGITTQSIANLHISTHAAFKACLFMAAGVIIHSCYDIQDNRRYGGLIKLLPIAYMGSLICSLSLIAIPYTSGSISKDLILEIHASQFTISHNIAFIIGSTVALITALYSIKLVIITYFSTSNMSNIVYERLHSANLYAYIPISVLTILAIGLGYIGYPSLIESYGITDSIVIAELGNPIAKLIPIIMVFLGIIIAIIWNIYNYSLNKLIYNVLVNRYYWPLIYTNSYRSYLNLCSKASRTIDLGILEMIGPHGLNKLFNK